MSVSNLVNIFDKKSKASTKETLKPPKKISIQELIQEQDDSIEKPKNINALVKKHEDAIEKAGTKSKEKAKGKSKEKAKEKAKGKAKEKTKEKQNDELVINVFDVKQKKIRKIPKLALLAFSAIPMSVRINITINRKYYAYNRTTNEATKCYNADILHDIIIPYLQFGKAYGKKGRWRTKDKITFHEKGNIITDECVAMIEFEWECSTAPI